MAKGQTTGQLVTKLKKRLKELESDKFLKECILFNLALQTNRIFGKGQRASGRPIGKYSKGYAKLRREKGRSTGKVVLQMTRLLRSDYGSSLTRVKVGTWVTGVKNGFNALKMDNILTKYGDDVFELSKSERKRFNLCLSKKRVKLGV